VPDPTKTGGMKSRDPMDHPKKRSADKVTISFLQVKSLVLEGAPRYVPRSAIAPGI
jgi:hypothetical protein